MPRRTGSVLGVLLMAAVVFFPAATYAAEVARITKEQLKGRIGEVDLSIIDVRYAGDWTGSDRKIAGAERGDPREVDRWAGKYAKDHPLVLYCA